MKLPRNIVKTCLYCEMSPQRSINLSNQRQKLYHPRSRPVKTTSFQTFVIFFLFFQAVACALYCTGFGESVAELLNWNNTWAVRGVGIGVIMLLLAVIIAGVKWVVKMQLLLLAILGVATLDFLVGTFAHSDDGKKKCVYLFSNLFLWGQYWGHHVSVGVIIAGVKWVVKLHYYRWPFWVWPLWTF